MTQSFKQGLADGVPIVLAYMALASTFGVLAVRTGLPVWAAVAMSFLGYAGAAQFIVLTLIAEGSSLAVMLGTTLLLNMRHLLLSSSLTTHLPKLRKRQISYMAHTITDESYGVNMMRAHRRDDLDYASVMGTNIIAHAAWVGGTWAGAVFGTRFAIDLSILNAAVPIMFTSLLAFQLMRKSDLMWMVLTALGTWIAMRLIPGHGAFLIPVLAIPTIAAIAESNGKGGRRAH